MAQFYSVLGFLAVSAIGSSEPALCDIISSLPLEMAITVLRLLPAKALLNAACVNSKWLRICKSDRKLRQKIRRYLRQLKRERLAALFNDNYSGASDSHASDRPLMINTVNTVSTPQVRVQTIIGMQGRMSSVRFMPYRRHTHIRPRVEKFSSLQHENYTSIPSSTRLRI